MGLGPAKVGFLEACRANGVDFARTVTLGRQTVYPSGVWADDLLRSFGAEVVDSIDGSGYEGATIVHDLNDPLPNDLGRYSTVVDAGTVEHVFDVAHAIRSVMRLCEVGGHVIVMAPANNWMGHGFWQVSPEALFRAFDKPSGFEVKAMLLVEHGRRPRLLHDPEEVGARVVVPTRRPAEVFMCARRVDDVEPVTPIQTDYSAAWAADAAPGRHRPAWLLRAAGPAIRRRATRRTSQRLRSFDDVRW